VFLSFGLAWVALAAAANHQVQLRGAGGSIAIGSQEALIDPQGPNGLPRTPGRQLQQDNSMQCGVDPMNTTTITSPNPKCPIENYCCSPFGFCGIEDIYCIGCQEKYGRCPAQCDVNKSFCGPFAIASFALGIAGAAVAVLALCVSCCALAKDGG
jgi:hypothetical protein